MSYLDDNLNATERITLFDPISDSNRTKLEKALKEHNEKALRYNQGKLKWSLIHYKSLEPMIRVLEYGAKKYEPWNWQKGLNKKEILESMMRHLIALMDGQEVDPESQQLHAAHVMCNSMFWIYFHQKEENDLE